MATPTKLGSAIVCDAGPNTLLGPIDIVGLQCAGAVTIKKGSDTILTFGAGTFQFSFRSSSSIIVTGACTILTRVCD